MPALKPLVHVRPSTATRAHNLSAQTKQLCRATAPLCLQRPHSAQTTPSLSPERVLRQQRRLRENEPDRLQTRSFECIEGVCTQSCSLFALSRLKADPVQSNVVRVAFGGLPPEPLSISFLYTRQSKSYRAKMLGILCFLALVQAGFSTQHIHNFFKSFLCRCWNCNCHRNTLHRRLQIFRWS